jgi:hypothetical protein
MEQFMCTCGVGVFPKGLLKTLKHFKLIEKYAVRVAIPVIFASPISSSGSGPATKSSPAVGTKTQAAKPAKAPRLEDLSAKEGSCFACGT